MIRFLAATLAFSTFASSGFAQDAKTVFETRLLPIFKSPNPSSCVQCHLAGVELKNYIRPTHEATFVSLRDQGLIDLDQPTQSKILKLIQMDDGDKSGAALIHRKNRTAEYDAFAAWIKQSAADPKLRNLPKAKADELAGPTRPVEVIRHDRKDRLAESFENTIWALRFRCMSCHIEGTAENKKLVEEHGPRVAWFKKDAATTLDYLANSRLVNIDTPRESLLLKKPLMEVKHGGGKKMLAGDQGYRMFLAFLEDFSKVKKDAYRDAASLPKKDDAARFGTDRWLKIANIPDAWGDRLLQVDVYAWDPLAKAWEPRPIATSDRPTWGKGKLWQHNLTLLAEPGSKRAATWRTSPAALPQGKYLVKVLVDTEKSGEPLGERNVVGQSEVTSAWPEGYGRMTVINWGR